MEKSLDLLEKTSNYYNDLTFVPKQLLMSCLDISSQLFIYPMKTNPSYMIFRYQLNHILSILWRDDVWIEWPAVRVATRTIESFLKAKIPQEITHLFDYSSIASLSSSPLLWWNLLIVVVIGFSFCILQDLFQLLAYIFLYIKNKSNHFYPLIFSPLSQQIKEGQNG
jgi:hypothetical protein